jgi:hypothetical protein
VAGQRKLKPGSVDFAQTVLNVISSIRPEVRTYDDLMVRIATCPLCEASCGILVDTDGERIHSIRGDEEDPFSRGYICPKAAALADLHDDPDRIRTPLIREGANWREASWEEALDRAADGLVRVRKKHGRDGVAIYYGNPVAHNLGLMTHALPFARMLRTRNVYSASSADQLPQMVAADEDTSPSFRSPISSEPTTFIRRQTRRIERQPHDGSGHEELLRAIRSRRAHHRRDPRARRPPRPPTSTWRSGPEPMPCCSRRCCVVFGEGWVRLGRFEGRVQHRRAGAPGACPPSAWLDGRRGLGRHAPHRRRVRRTTRPLLWPRGVVHAEARDAASWLVQCSTLCRHLDEVGGMMLTTPAVDAVAIMPGRTANCAVCARASSYSSSVIRIAWVQPS